MLDTLSHFPPGKLYPTLEKPVQQPCEADTFGMGDCSQFAAISTLPYYLPMDQEYPWMVLCVRHLSYHLRRQVCTTEAALLDGEIGTPSMLLGLTFQKMYYYYGLFMRPLLVETSPGVVLYRWECSPIYGRWISREIALTRLKERLPILYAIKYAQQRRPFWMTR